MPESLCIKLWSWEDAPDEFKVLSTRDDQDWVLLVPRELIDHPQVEWWVPDTSGRRYWLHPFGWGVGYDHPLGRVAIFAHA